MYKTITACTLPDRVYEGGYRRFAISLCKHDASDEVAINMKKCTHLTPFAILLLLSKIRYWKSEGIKISFDCEENAFFQYLQRMNFFRLFDYNTEEKFTRHDARDNFLPIAEFGPGSRNDLGTEKDPDQLAELISGVMLPKRKSADKANFKQGLHYSCFELIMNVIQHSNGTGHAFAQYNRHMDYARIAILDDGIGIKGSFDQMDSKHYNQRMTDKDAINKSLEPAVSSKPIGYGHENAGLGLTMIKGIVDAIGGNLTIISNKGYVSTGESFNNGTKLINGTLCSITLRRSKLSNFAELLRGVRVY